MPTILMIYGFKFQVFSEGRFKMAHVHAFKGGAEAKVSLIDGRVYYARQFDQKTIRWIESYVSENKEILLKAWEEINSQD